MKKKDHDMLSHVSKHVLETPLQRGSTLTRIGLRPEKFTQNRDGWGISIRFDNPRRASTWDIPPQRVFLDLDNVEKLISLLSRELETLVRERTEKAAERQLRGWDTEAWGDVILTEGGEE